MVMSLMLLLLRMNLILSSPHIRERDGFGSGDLYISYRISDNVWTKAKNLGAEINSDKMDYCPYVDTKTNTLYFTSKRSDSK